MLFTCVFSKEPVGECPPVQELERLRRENRILKDMLGDLEKEISRLRCERKEMTEEETDCHGASRLAMTGKGVNDVYLVNVEIDLERDKPLRIRTARVVRENRRYVYFSYFGRGPEMKEKPLAKAKLHKLQMHTPAWGYCYLLSSSENRAEIEDSDEVRLVVLELLDEINYRMQRCAVRENELRDFMEAMRE